MFFILLFLIQNQKYVESKVDEQYSGTLLVCSNCTKTTTLEEQQHVNKDNMINSSTHQSSSFTLLDYVTEQYLPTATATTTTTIHTALQQSKHASNNVPSAFSASGMQTIIKSRRDTRNKENLISALRKQLHLKDNKKDEQPMADARLEQNYSAPYHSKMPADSVNVEQDFNKNNNKLRQLHNLHYPIREQGYIMPAEVECTFEESCKWQWRTDIRDGFINTTSSEYSATDTGPKYDADNRTAGECVNNNIHTYLIYSYVHVRYRQAYIYIHLQKLVHGNVYHHFISNYIMYTYYTVTYTLELYKTSYSSVRSNTKIPRRSLSLSEPRALSSHIGMSDCCSSDQFLPWKRPSCCHSNQQEGTHCAYIQVNMRAINVASLQLTLCITGTSKSDTAYYEPISSVYIAKIVYYRPFIYTSIRCLPGGKELTRTAIGTYAPEFTDVKWPTCKQY